MSYYDDRDDRDYWGHEDDWADPWAEIARERAEMWQAIVSGSRLARIVDWLARRLAR